MRFALAMALGCVALHAAGQVPVHIVPAPEVVPPPRIDVPPPVAPVFPTPALPPPPLEIPRPVPLAQCDPGGCWDANGQRLNSVGSSPVLIGPKGPCIAANGVASCR